MKKYGGHCDDVYTGLVGEEFIVSGDIPSVQFPPSLGPSLLLARTNTGEEFYSKKHAFPNTIALMTAPAFFPFFLKNNFRKSFGGKKEKKGNKQKYVIQKTSESVNLGLEEDRNRENWEAMTGFAL
ncbi:hypothetical protein CEXT_267591 [Caerostris extrusa]|uniref:Uncharacterized protein n=1 Tax=Caerostris extrusa TaxID=172846 RepID=A0AAV4UL40_CAEEX|nr:hypothetical protein CEXT_267591 [Caerostris extrusa]